MQLNISQPQSKLRDIIKTIYPTYQIYEEYHLGERLRLDLFIKDLGIAIEYHGEQHFKFIPFFHRTEREFEEAKQRDILKLEKCEELGICLISFLPTDSLEEGFVRAKIKSMIENHNFSIYDPNFQLDTFKEREKQKRKTAQKQRYIAKKNNRPKKDLGRLAKERELRRIKYLKGKEWKQQNKQNN